MTTLRLWRYCVLILVLENLADGALTWSFRPPSQETITVDLTKTNPCGNSLYTFSVDGAEESLQFSSFTQNPDGKFIISEERLYCTDATLLRNNGYSSYTLTVTVTDGVQTSLVDTFIVTIVGLPNNPCKPNPCQNGGTCNIAGSTYNCTCTSGYEGPNCLTIVTTTTSTTTTTATTTATKKPPMQNASPVFSKPSTSDQITSCFENWPKSSRIYRVSASDADGDTVTVTIHSQIPSAPPFQLANVTIGWNLLTPSSTAIDRNTTPTFTFVFNATDGINTVQSVVLTLIVNDENNSPQFTKSSYLEHVYTTASAGEVILTIHATDADVNASISYRITPNTAGVVNGTFSLAHDTGELTLDKPGNLNPATTPTYNFTVEALYHNTTTATVTIHVLDNPCKPNPCQNGGTCTTAGSTYNCTCTSGYEGPNCSTIVTTTTTTTTTITSITTYPGPIWIIPVSVGIGAVVITVLIVVIYKVYISKMNGGRRHLMDSSRQTTLTELVPLDRPTRHEEILLLPDS